MITQWFISFSSQTRQFVRFLRAADSRQGLTALANASFSVPGDELTPQSMRGVAHSWDDTLLQNPDRLETLARRRSVTSPADGFRNPARRSGRLGETAYHNNVLASWDRQPLIRKKNSFIRDYSNNVSHASFLIVSVLLIAGQLTIQWGFLERSKGQLHALLTPCFPCTRCSLVSRLSRSLSLSASQPFLSLCTVSLHEQQWRGKLQSMAQTLREQDQRLWESLTSSHLPPWNLYSQKSLTRRRWYPYICFIPPPLWRQSNCDRGSSSLNIIRPWKYPFNALHWMIHWPYLCADCPWMPDIAIRMLCFSCVPCCKFAPAARQTVMIPAGLGVLPGPSSPLGIFFFFSGEN